MTPLARFGWLCAGLLVLALGLQRAKAWYDGRVIEAAARDARITAYGIKDLAYKDTLSALTDTIMSLRRDSARVAKLAAAADTKRRQSAAIADSLGRVTRALYDSLRADAPASVIAVLDVADAQHAADSAALADEQAAHALTRDGLAVERQTRFAVEQQLGVTNRRFDDFRQLSVDLEARAYQNGVKRGRMQVAVSVAPVLAIILYAAVK